MTPAPEISQAALALKDEIIGTSDGGLFHEKLLQYANLTNHWHDDDIVPDKFWIVIDGKTFDFDIKLDASQLPRSVIIQFKNCTFRKLFCPIGFRAVVTSNCIFNEFELSALPFQSCNVYEGSIEHLFTPKDSSSGGAKFADLNIKKFTIYNSIFEVFFPRVIFERIKTISWSKDVTLKAVRFNECTFDCLPDFLECSFKKDVEFKDCIFMADKSNAAVFYRDLKHKMSDNKNDFAAAFFSGKELRCTHDEIRLIREKVLSWGYRILSNYGLAPYRPMIYLFVLTVGSYWCWKFSIELFGLFKMKEHAIPLDANDQAMYLAAISMLGPWRVLGTFDLLIINTPWPQMILWFFTSVSSLLWFFFLLAIRRRFKVD